MYVEKKAQKKIFEIKNTSFLWLSKSFFVCILSLYEAAI